MKSIMKATSLTENDKLKAESVTGGAGEGSQLLRPDSDFEEREKVSFLTKWFHKNFQEIHL